MEFPNRETVERIRKEYPQGTRVELVSMSDPYSKLSPGDTGTVKFVDDIGTVFVNWDCGSGLGIVYGEDSIRKLTKAEIIKMQTRAVADTGLTNMFDVKIVLEIAVARGFNELADFIFTDTAGYSRLILTGECEVQDA